MNNCLAYSNYSYSGIGPQTAPLTVCFFVCLFVCFLFRCIALNALGVYIVEELVHSKGCFKVADCICVLLTSITVSLCNTL